jgi:hypothetical protein
MKKGAGYTKAICRSLGVDRLEPLSPTTPPTPDAPLSLAAVTIHEAKMNSLPYLVARVGTVLGPPAAALLTYPRHRESALARTQDVFKVGDQGQVYRDFMEAGHRLGKRDAEIVAEWRVGEQAVVWATQRGE